MPRSGQFRAVFPNRSRIIVPLLAAALASSALVVGARPAAANAPGNPGTPAAPTTVFTEDFEHGPATVPTLLTDYTGAGPLDETYTADPAWVDTAVCNGFIVSEQDPATPPTGCPGSPAWALIQASAADLGSWAGGDATTNHALIQYTDADPGAGKVQLQTAQPIALPSAGRFLTVRTDAAGENCFANHPLYQFNLLDGAAASPTSSTPIDPCVGAGEVVTGPGGVDVYVGTYTGNEAVLSSSASVGIQLIDQQAYGYGSDGALDNIRLLDVTPQLDLSSTTGAVQVGASAELTFTVTNTSELDAKDGWSFTANLPTGLTLANGNATTTCASGTATAGSAAGTIDVGGDLAAGQSSCTVTVPVTSIYAGTYRLCAQQITNIVGLDPPACTALTFVSPIFDARANSALLNLSVLDLGPVAPSAYECTSAPGSVGNSVAGVSLGTAGTLGLLTTSASGTIAADGTRTATASARSASLNLLAGLITADEVATTAQARQPLTTSGPGAVTVSGGTTLTNLRIAGVAITADPAPNTTIGLPLVGSVVLNEQKTIAGGDGITVTALDITLLSGTHLTIATSTSALLSTSQTCPTA